MSKSRESEKQSRENKPSDLVVGSVTFVIFIIFMTVWMYYTA